MIIAYLIIIIIAQQCLYDLSLSVTIIGGIVFLIFALSAFFIEG